MLPPHALGLISFGAVSCIDLDASAASSSDSKNISEQISADAGENRFLSVHLPVNLRQLEEVRGTQLQVTADLAAPPGQPPPVAIDMGPRTDYAPETRSRSVHLGVGPSQAAAGLDLSRERIYQEIVRDASGLSEHQVIWTIGSDRSELAGSYDFVMTVKVPLRAFAWVTVSAVLKPAPKRWPLSKADPVKVTKLEPLCSPAEPQAPATLHLLQEQGDGALVPLLVGRPQMVTLTHDHGTIMVGPPNRRPPGATAVIEYSSDTGEPTFMYRNLTGEQVSLAGGDGDPLGPAFLLKSGDRLLLSPGVVLQVLIDEVRPAFGGTSSSPLTVTVLVDGSEQGADTYGEQYVSVGREQQNIRIARPEISARHGHFELDADGWWYHHDSRTTAQAFRERGGTSEAVSTGGRIQLRPGDVMRLTGHVRLRIDFDPGLQAADQGGA
jgi:hypothetical protein